jgi:outer membrane protein assembly factor BamB
MFARPYRLPHLGPRRTDRSRHALWFALLLMASLALTLAACGSASPPTGAHATATPTIPRLALDAQLAHETLYVINASPTAISATGWSLTALNAQTGMVRWKLPTGGMIGRPVIANGVIYFAPQDGYVYAVDAATGHVRWRFQRTVNISQTVGIDGYPALDGDTLYVASDGGAVYALDASSGKQRWLFTLPSHGHMYAAPTAGNGMVYVSSAGGSNTFYALDEATGKVAWQLTEPGGFDSYPLLAGKTVYTGANAYYQASFYALDAQTGKIRWQYQAPNLVITRPALDGNHLFIGVTDSTVREVNAQTGKEGWRAAIGDQLTVAGIPTGAAPTVADGVVYAGGQNALVEALDEATGAVKWKQAVDASVDSAPTVAGGTDGAVFVTTEKGSVYAFRASDGALSWKYDDGGLIYASPVFA